MTVRAALSTDIPSLARLNRFVQDLHVQAKPRFFKMPSVEELEGFFRDALSKETRAFIAEEGDVAVGYLLAAFGERQEDAFFRPRRWLQIDQISVDPAFQRRGHGRNLVTAAMECARAAGIEGVQTGVWAFNEPSLSFFHDQGFERSELRLRLTMD